MKLAGYQVPDACFYACPITDFEALASEVDTHEEDLGRAKAAGLSEEAVVAVAALGVPIGARVAQVVRTIPDDQRQARPWKPSIEGLSPAAARAANEVQCCKMGGIVLAGKGDIVKVSRS